MFEQTHPDAIDTNYDDGKWLYLSDEAELEAQSHLEEVIEIDSLDEEVSFENPEQVLDFSPQEISFEERHAEINNEFNTYVECLVNKIEEQAQLIAERDKEILEKDSQLKLIPDLEKQLRSKEEEAKLEYFESAALKKQIDLLKADKETTEKVARISKAILNEVESESKQRTIEIEKAKDTEIKLANLQKELVDLKRPWWHKLLGINS